MTHLAVKISTKTVKLRKKVKKLEHDAHVAGHPKREAFYRFIQHKLKQFGNWFFTLWSEETQELMLATECSRYQIHGTNVPEWVKMQFAKDGK